MLKSQIILSILLSIIFTGCSTKSIRIPVTRPAAISVDPEIKSIAVINRSVPSNKLLSKIEAVITGEDLTVDKDGSEALMQSLMARFEQSTRFSVERTTVNLKKHNFLNTLPEPLAWHKVKKLSKRFSADGILVLELFDSDFSITKKEKVIDKTDKKTRPLWTVEGIVKVTAGFRLYYPSRKIIADEYTYTRDMKWRAEGNSVADAMQALISRNNAVIAAGRSAGAVYAGRIIPSNVYAKRKIYVKPRDDGDFERGVRMMEIRDWDGALPLMEKAFNSSSGKTKGRAAYNLAIIEESRGKLEKAREWSKEAYVKYGEKRAKGLTAILEYRIDQEQILQEQMGEE